MAQINREIFRVFGYFLGFLLLIQIGHAFEFKVGGPTASWKVPSDDSNAASFYNQWAQKNRFQIGDTLLFVYNADVDSVLHVSKYDYESCNTESPAEKFADGHTVFKFNQSGPHYFISGVADHCRKNEKLVVVVMADRTGKHGSSAAPPSPPPSPENVPVPPPSPAPSGESPPSDGAEENPTPAPSEEDSPPNNGASSSIVGVASFLGSVAAFVLAI
ncbi:hypothetical protein ABFS82_08G177400 [Erythranthe guttata]|uniref:Phytocyanin domain-containing protein n=1 Tax=Erythranthe guttata TaxID=4155 RepID=A0A022R054_ERYGU|nr:PREDICTED: early nodulin-like protein 3 [Erythranthe guttata]EYU33616.1 hypothetical protein MIMGU_mgv1a013589mg [Erythranthe guttata]|eukprot:XP_012841738.1 PREDICTED: early nodulin-like protein 3 [Erythranthe guttata]